MTGLRAAVTLGLTGRYAVQAGHARAGLELWADDDHVELQCPRRRGFAQRGGGRLPRVPRQ